MVLFRMLPRLLIEWNDVKKADLKLGHAAFLKKMDVIWIGVMCLSETHLFAVERIGSTWERDKHKSDKNTQQYKYMKLI